jgi:3-methylcrotonyl-CoA carboxylase beta subunit
VLLQIEKARLSKEGGFGEKEEKELLDRIGKRYKEQMSPFYAASRMWVDAIIDPRDTRAWVSAGIEMADHNPEVRAFNMGVLQT